MFSVAFIFSVEISVFPEYQIAKCSISEERAKNSIYPAEKDPVL